MIKRSVIAYSHNKSQNPIVPIQIQDMYRQIIIRWKQNVYGFMQISEYLHIIIYNRLIISHFIACLRMLVQSVSRNKWTFILNIILSPVNVFCVLCI